MSMRTNPAVRDFDRWVYGTNEEGPFTGSVTFASFTIRRTGPCTDLDMC